MKSLRLTGLKLASEAKEGIIGVADSTDREEVADNQMERAQGEDTRVSIVTVRITRQEIVQNLTETKTRQNDPEMTSIIKKTSTLKRATAAVEVKTSLPSLQRMSFMDR